jgi:hypothetical protein
MNETLESLELKSLRLSDYDTNLGFRAFSFLRTNKALKSLAVGVDSATHACLSAFQIDVTTMLQENTSLESLSFVSWGEVDAEEFVALVAALQQNETLKKLQCNDGKMHEDKHMAEILKKNYALESLPDIYLENRSGDVSAILQLNAAGRRYLIEDGSSVSKGVEVLSAVSSDINCVFLHLLENPRLCDRSAVEMAGDSNEARRGSTNPANHNGKREQGRVVEEGKESRKRRV